MPHAMPEKIIFNTSKLNGLNKDYMNFNLRGDKFKIKSEPLSN